MIRPLRRGLRVLIWAAAGLFGLMLWAAARYVRDLPADYGFLAPDRLDELYAKGVIWLVLTAVPFVLLLVLGLVLTLRRGRGE